MKKALVIFFVLMICLSLCACGSSKKYEKYETLIDYVESDNYMAAYSELQKIINERNKDESKEIVTVEITPENWQEYFEIRPYERKHYNDFGDLDGHEVGYGFYLKSEYLDALSEGSPDLPDGPVNVSFKVSAAVEYREYNNAENEFVEGGEVLKVEKDELVVEAYNQKIVENTENDVSTSYGQVCAFMCYNGGAGANGKSFWGVYTDDITVLDVTGTLAFEKEVSSDSN